MNKPGTCTRGGKETMGLCATDPREPSHKVRGMLTKNKGNYLIYNKKPPCSQGGCRFPAVITSYRVYDFLIILILKEPDGFFGIPAFYMQQVNTFGKLSKS